ncbi:FadR/GntR family transcriptional regulator [Sphingobium lignivorans]|uniref:DNA-binding FadR family transcriptional regulator n=1 Tax=Sphingobium lignivorans TaxID=2735886 RepID=A0ABR6NHZ7_9SPHN|nr:GntR family transcriptional regulator [Sphingobium lignivorans]MBB5986910.1 DNA-binding FadR family transcriptional regulator [Sphingobium lignivorans]
MSVAERIYTASTREDESPSRLAEQLARQIEDDIAWQRLTAGEALGSLRDLSDRYSVGRAVIREAVGLLERRGLGSLRPGPCGGFIVKKPLAQSIGEEIADYFRTADITLAHLLDAREAVDQMIARLAALARPPLPRLVRLEAAVRTPGLGGHLALRNELARLTGEPVVMLLIKCLNSLTLDFAMDGAAPGDQPRIAIAAMREALASGDTEMAVQEADRLHEELTRYLHPQKASQDIRPIESARLADERTLAVSVARKLAVEIARSGTTGQRLGSEWDLCERFSVSRLTLRQAIRILQDSGLVECRRGRGNGLVVRNRRGTGTIRLMLAYLIGQQMDVRAAGTILFQLNCFMPALAVSRADREQRRALERLISRLEESDTLERYDLLSLVHCVSQLAQSPIIDLFSRCLAAYEARFHPSLAERLPVGLQASYFRLVRQLLNGTSADGHTELEWAKARSAHVMLEMSRSRPI